MTLVNQLQPGDIIEDEDKGDDMVIAVIEIHPTEPGKALVIWANEDGSHRFEALEYKISVGKVKVMNQSERLEVWQEMISGNSCRGNYKEDDD